MNRVIRKHLRRARRAKRVAAASDGIPPHVAAQPLAPPYERSEPPGGEALMSTPPPGELPAPSAGPGETVDSGAQAPQERADAASDAPQVLSAAQALLAPAAPGGLAAPLSPRSVLEHFLAGRSPRTREAYEADLRLFAEWQGLEIDEALRRLLLGGPQNGHVLALGWLQEMTARELAPATISRRLASLRSLVKLGHQLGMADWTLSLKGPKVVGYRDTRGPGVEGFRELLRHVGDGLVGRRNRTMLLVTFALGLRRSELAALRLQDYDREQLRLGVRGKGKGGQVEWMTLPEVIASELDSWLCISRQLTCDGAGPVERLDEEPLFFGIHRATQEREPLSGEGIRYIFARIGKKAGVKVRPHGLRHAAITAVLEETSGNVRQAQRFSRHADVRTLMTYDDNREDLGGQSSELIVQRVLKEDDTQKEEPDETEADPDETGADPDETGAEEK